MKVFKVSDYYTGDSCPNCGRNRLLTYDTENGKKTVCEKCDYCVEDNSYFEAEFESEYEENGGAQLC